MIEPTEQEPVENLRKKLRIVPGGCVNPWHDHYQPRDINRFHNRRTAFPQVWVWKILAALTIWGLAAWAAIEINK